MKLTVASIIAQAALRLALLFIPAQAQDCETAKEVVTHLPLQRGGFQPPEIEFTVRHGDAFANYPGEIWPAGKLPDGVYRVFTRYDLPSGFVTFSVYSTINGRYGQGVIVTAQRANDHKVPRLGGYACTEHGRPDLHRATGAGL